MRRVELDESTNATLKARNAERVARRRRAEQADALHFLVYGHDEHVGRCVFNEGVRNADGTFKPRALRGEPCSRDYDPLPYSEAAPTPARDYVGTGVGALYGLPGWERHVWQLAGWNVSIQEVTT